MHNKTFDVEYPFSEKYDRGTLVVNPEGRRNVILQKSGKSITTVSYARYLMSVFMKRFLKRTEIVDHINGVKTDDYLSNLQIISSKENNLKSSLQNNLGKKFVLLVCPMCKTEFELERRQSFLAKGTKFNCCTRKCARQFSAFKLTEQQALDLGKNQVLKEFVKYPELESTTRCT